MASLGTITLGTFTNISSTAIIGVEPVLEAIASANDTTHVFDNTNSTHTGVAQFALGNMPADFATILTVSIQLRYLAQAAQTNTWTSLTAQIVQSDGSTALTNEVTVASSITTTTATNSSVITLTGPNTSADKATWDGALVLIRWNITRNKGGDTVQKRVTAAEVTGTYTPAGITLTTVSGAGAVGSVGISGTAPTVTTQAVDGISGTNATGHGTVTAVGAPDLTERGVCWDTAANPTTANSRATSAGQSGAFTASITGLTLGGITYHVRAYATNAAGTSYGSDVTFVTGPAAPTVTTTLTPESTGATHAYVKGSVTSDGGGTITERGFVWNTAGSPTTADNKVVVSGTVGGLRVAITGLSPSTTYKFRAYAINSSGTGYGPSSGTINTTAATVPVVNTSSISSVTYNSAVGGGEVLTDGGAAITERGICWLMGSTPLTTDSKTTTTGTTGAFSGLSMASAINREGPGSGTWVYVRAYAINSVGTGYGPVMIARVPYRRSTAYGPPGPAAGASVTITTPTLTLVTTDVDGIAHEALVYVWANEPAWNLSRGGLGSAITLIGGGGGGIRASSDGAYFYVASPTNDWVYQYAFADYPNEIAINSINGLAQKILYVGGEETNVRALAFSSDGTKCYIVGTTNSTVFQYTLDTAWDLSTGYYSGKSFSVLSQDNGTWGLDFSSDGSKMYVAGQQNDRVYQYELSTAWDVSTAVYNTHFMSIGSQSTNVGSLCFSDDGTKCYVGDWSTRILYQYTLTTAWDITTGSYASLSLNASATITNNLVGMCFTRGGGRTMLITDSAGNVFVCSFDRVSQATLFARSSIDPGFANQTTPADTTPFNSGDTVGWTVWSGSALTDSAPYWWGVAWGSGSGSDPDTRSLYHLAADYTLRAFNVNTSLAGGPPETVRPKSIGLVATLYPFAYY